MPDRVFTEEFSSRLLERYSRFPDDKKPFIYRLTIDATFKEMREKIERTIDLAPAEARRGLIGRLQSAENCINTYHELMVGSALKKLGFIVEYEPVVNRKTPDWRITDPLTKKQAIVEVFTCNISDEEKSMFIQLGDLAYRLNKIRKGVYLAINYSRQASLDQNRNKEIASEVSQWLTRGVKVGDKLTVKCLNDSKLDIKVEMVDDKLPHIITSPSLEYARVIDPEPLRKKIQVKISDYGPIALNTKTSLIIAIIPDLYTGYALDSLDDALLGSDITRVYFAPNMGIVGMKNVRGDDGVQADNRSLTGVIWMDNDREHGWHIKKYRQNPEALYPFDIPE